MRCTVVVDVTFDATLLAVCDCTVCAAIVRNPPSPGKMRRPGQLSRRVNIKRVGVNIKKSIFSRAPRRTMWKWQTRCGQPRRLAKNALLYVKSPQPGKPRKWPPDTCGMAFEKLNLLLLAGVTASRTLRCRSQRPTVLEHHPCRSSPSRA